MVCWRLLLSDHFLIVEILRKMEHMRVDEATKSRVKMMFRFMLWIDSLKINTHIDITLHLISFSNIFCPFNHDGFDNLCIKSPKFWTKELLIHVFNLLSLCFLPFKHSFAQYRASISDHFVPITPDSHYKALYSAPNWSTNTTAKAHFSIVSPFLIRHILSLLKSKKTIPKYSIT